MMPIRRPVLPLAMLMLVALGGCGSRGDVARPQPSGDAIASGVNMRLSEAGTICTCAVR